MWDKVIRTGGDLVEPALPEPSPTEVNIVNNIAAEIENVFRDYLQTKYSRGRGKRSPRLVMFVLTLSHIQQICSSISKIS